MEDALLEIIDAVKSGYKFLDAAWVERVLRKHNRASHDPARRIAKRRLLPLYLSIKAQEPERWASWEIDPACERKLLQLLRMKPRRTASGVATITVLTRPWPCSSDCLYCPSDIRMPKSYLSDEPACQRAERNFFDPYLQVHARMLALFEMGHVVDKVELIILGGSWSDYPKSYQLWFMHELFRAVSDFGLEQPSSPSAEEIEMRYQSCGLSYERDVLLAQSAPLQKRINAGQSTYNEAFEKLYTRGPWKQAATHQEASFEDLEAQHKRNEGAKHRVVGLTIETRPDLITHESARFMRSLGCTKIQMGIQSLDDEVLAKNGRASTVSQIEQAFAILRLHGYKIQVHAMVNLLGSTAEKDMASYAELVSHPRFCPDEVKIYPCALVESSRLTTAYERGEWTPYPEETLMKILVHDVLATPPYVRISRMIRDISADDIIAGNKRTNLRQMVEARIDKGAAPVQEIRAREVATANVATSELELSVVRYATTVSEERFLQWVDEAGSIAGFLRLSLPQDSCVAMIREVHVYGRVAGIHEDAGGAAQHAGLGRALIEEACTQAKELGFEEIDVISSVGTRKYYRSLGFVDRDLYQRRTLASNANPR